MHETNFVGLNFTDNPFNSTLFTNIINQNEKEIYFKNPEEMLIPWIVNPYFFPIIITYVVTFIIGVTGNMLVIWFMLVNKENRTVTTLFLVSLSVSDLLLLLIYAPLEIINYFVLQWDKNGTICRLASFVESISAFGSVLNLIAVTIERFVVIVFPIQSRTVCVMHNCKKVLTGVWIFSLVFATPMLFNKTTIKTSFTNYQTTVNIYYCKESNDWIVFSIYIYRFLTLFVLPSFTMIICYTFVIFELWLSNKNSLYLKTGSNTSYEMQTMVGKNKNGSNQDRKVQFKTRKNFWNFFQTKKISKNSSTNDNIVKEENKFNLNKQKQIQLNKKKLEFNTKGFIDSNSFNKQQSSSSFKIHILNESIDDKSAKKQIKKKKKVIKMLILIVALFLICWGSRLIMEVTIKCCLYVFNHKTYTLRVIFYLLPFIHSCLNPIVYMFLSTKFRNQLILLWKKIFKKQKLKKKNHFPLSRKFSSLRTLQSDASIRMVTFDT